MPTPTKGPRLGGGPAHERLMLANLATALFEHGRITTTNAKARRLRPFAEKLVTFAKRGDLHARRQVLAVIRRTDVAHHLFDEIGPRYVGRPGGYTRIIKLEPRQGDNAPMAVIELVEAAAQLQSAPSLSRSERLRRSRHDADDSVAALAGGDDEEAMAGAAAPAASAVDSDEAAEAASPQEDEAEAAAPQEDAPEGDKEK